MYNYFSSKCFKINKDTPVKTIIKTIISTYFKPKYVKYDHLGKICGSAIPEKNKNALIIIKIAPIIIFFIFYHLFLRCNCFASLKPEAKRNVLYRRKALENTSYTVRVCYHSGWLPIVHTVGATFLVTCFYDNNLMNGRLITAKNPIIPNTKKILADIPAYSKKHNAISPTVPFNIIFIIELLYYFLTPPSGSFENNLLNFDEITLKNKIKNYFYIYNQILYSLGRKNYQKLSKTCNTSFGMQVLALLSRLQNPAFKFKSLRSCLPQIGFCKLFSKCISIFQLKRLLCKWGKSISKSANYFHLFFMDLSRNLLKKQTVVVS